MPLTALEFNDCLVDSTEMSDDLWLSIYKKSKGANLRCRECIGALHAKVSSTGLRFFSHTKRPESCSNEGESAEHRRLKKVVASLIREAGGKAEIEAHPHSSDFGGWRADVLGTNPDGHRFAFEIQLASMTIEVGLERTAKYMADGIKVFWVTTKHARWMNSIHSLKITSVNGDFVVERGLAQLRKEIDWAGWKQRDLPIRLDVVIDRILKEEIAQENDRIFIETVSGKSRWTYNAKLLVHKYDIPPVAEYLEKVRLRDIAQAEHFANIQELIRRQERILQKVVQIAKESLHPGETIWLGAPSKKWNGVFPVSQETAKGNDKTASGCVIWIGKSPQTTRLFAVICPVASRTNIALGALWAKREVKVFVETTEEAIHVSRNLNWELGKIDVCDS